MEKVKEVVLQLMQHKDALPFLEPVDWKELELFDYPVIVKNPMDLGTVQRNLEQNKYETAGTVSNGMDRSFAHTPHSCLVSRLCPRHSLDLDELQYVSWQKIYRITHFTFASDL